MNTVEEKIIETVEDVKTEQKVTDEKTKPYGLVFTIPGLNDIRKQLPGYNDWVNDKKKESSEDKPNNKKNSDKKKFDKPKNKTYYPFLKKLSRTMVNGHNISIQKTKRAIDQIIENGHYESAKDINLKGDSLVLILVKDGTEITDNIRVSTVLEED